MAVSALEAGGLGVGMADFISPVFRWFMSMWMPSALVSFILVSCNKASSDVAPSFSAPVGITIV